jgi:NitT/TauT family transport system substrate-binding protein
MNVVNYTHLKNNKLLENTIMLKTIMKQSALALTLMATFAAPTFAADTPSKSDKVTIATSVYAGWMPWYSIKESGIVDQVNQEMGTNIKIRTYGTYEASFMDYTGHAVQGVTLTNMDVLLSPAEAGVTSIAVINGDASHGNDAIVANRKMSCEEMDGKKVYLMEGTVSQYVLNSFLSTCGLSDLDVKMQNTTDADIATLFLENNDPDLVVVTWNPVVATIMSKPNAVELYNSAQIEDEILDSMYMNTGLAPEVYQAVNEMWYRGMKMMTTRGKGQREMMNTMASAAEVTPKQLAGQFKTTKFYSNQESAKSFVESDRLKEVMAKVTKFIQDKEMLPNTKDISEIGIQFPDGTVLGSKDNIQVIFTSEYLK